MQGRRKLSALQQLLVHSRTCYQQLVTQTCRGLVPGTSGSTRAKLTHLTQAMNLEKLQDPGSQACKTQKSCTMTLRS